MEGMKVKIFAEYSSNVVQNEINEWLSTHEKVNVVKVCQSNGEGHILVISIFYTE